MNPSRISGSVAVAAAIVLAVAVLTSCSGRSESASGACIEGASSRFADALERIGATEGEPSASASTAPTASPTSAASPAGPRLEPVAAYGPVRAVLIPVRTFRGVRLRASFDPASVVLVAGTDEGTGAWVVGRDGQGVVHVIAANDVAVAMAGPGVATIATYGIDDWRPVDPAAVDAAIDCLS